MTRLYFIFLTLIIISCSCNQETKTAKNGFRNNDSIETTSVHIDTTELIDSSLKFSTQHVLFEDYQNAIKKSKDKLLKDTSSIKKMNGQIRLPLNNGFYSVKDTNSKEDETAIIEHKYLGKFPSIEKYIIESSFYEGFEIKVIDQITGKNYSLWNTPKLSPDDSYFANLSEEYGMEGVPLGFQVWKVNKTKEMQKYIELDQKDWVPLDLVWLDNQSFILKVTTVDKYVSDNFNTGNSSDFYYLKIKLR